MTNTTGWNIWRGDGDCPVNKEAIVDIRLRSGRIIERATAGRYLWARPRREAEGQWSPTVTENGGVIVAYREIGEVA
ncbi:hypothetical protein HFN71_28900 [Rhizobium laguerreae]|uniref:hypothetical protein n=1 Tax=Rhizobium laguerreae TaxID=1076926 RepID=UPI001C91AF69|nr:hypothetical protein [Rhizobium laguerreae]MBY3543704.1 hypothetical protein [Rhizobium laguerreae]